MSGAFLEDQFRCSICLDIFKNPVSIPCGHNFCLGCVRRFWDTRSKAECPLCKETFKNRPDLRVNVVLRDCANEFRRSHQLKSAIESHQGALIMECESKQEELARRAQDLQKELNQEVNEIQRRRGEMHQLELVSASPPAALLPAVVVPPPPSQASLSQVSRAPEPSAALLAPLAGQAPSAPEPATQEVLCDVCKDPQLSAVKSCLVCQASYCDMHLTLHQRDPVLQKHRLTDPATFSTSHLCRRHNKPLEMFCKKDQTPVCSECCARDHRNHQTMSIPQATRKVKESLKGTKTELKKLIRERIQKTEEIQRAVDQSKKITERQIQQSVEVCTMLISAMEREQSTVVEELQRRQEEVEEKANQLINHLQAEMKALQNRGSEIVTLQATHNTLHILQGFPSLNKVPPTQNWTDVKVYPDSGMGAMRDTVSKMIEICQQLSSKLLEEEVEQLSQYSLNVTYDPETASGWLDISEDGKQVSLTSLKKKKTVSDSEKRFDSCVCVLGKETFSSGRQYWEVQ
ncbi:hypothetical protein NL108_009617, partial [Boleophthalmus pectinirostris]